MLDMSAKNQLTSESLLTLEETSTVLRRSHWTLRGDIKAGRLKCIRMGRRILIEKSEIERLIDEAREVRAASTQADK